MMKTDFNFKKRVCKYNDYHVLCKINHRFLNITLDLPTSYFLFVSFVGGKHVHAVQSIIIVIGLSWTLKLNVVII